MVVENESVGGAAKKWDRFIKLRLQDYYYMSYNYWDAVCYVPQKAITFLGFGVLGHYNNNDCNHKVQWVIEDDASEEVEVDFKQEDRCPETKTW